MRRFLLLIVFVVVIGGVVGAALDQIHVRGGALSYAHASWIDQAWWVAPQFGIAFALGAVLGLLLQHHLDPAGQERPETRRIVIAMVWFVGAYAATGILWRDPWILTVLLLVALVVRCMLHPPDRLTGLIMLVLAVAGTTYEGSLAAFDGTFSYADPQLATVPIWLPLLYVHSAPLVRELLVVGARFVWPVSRPAPLP